MSNLLEKIKRDSITAMKNGDKNKLAWLRLLIAEIEKEKISLKADSMSDEQTQAVVTRQVKKLDKEIEAYQAVNRDTENQETEKELLLSYLPKQLTEDEIRTEVMIAVDLTKSGVIKNPMAHLSKQLKGKADMGLVSKIVKELSK